MGIERHALWDLVQEMIDANLARKGDDGCVYVLPGVESCPHRDVSPLAGGPQAGRPPARSTQAISLKSSDSGLPPSGENLAPASGDGRPQALAVREYNPAKTARGLVDYFRVQCAKNFFGRTPGALNADALRAQISRWIRNEGIPYDTVKAMIDVFVSDQQFIRATTPAWKSFINQRQKLFEIAERRTKAKTNMTRWEKEIRDARNGDR